MNREEKSDDIYKMISQYAKRIGIMAKTLVINGEDQDKVDEYVAEQMKVCGEIAHGDNGRAMEAILEDLASIIKERLGFLF